MRKALFGSLVLITALGISSAPVFADTLQYVFATSAAPAGSVTETAGQFTGSGIDIDYLTITDQTTNVDLGEYDISGTNSNGDASLAFNTNPGSLSFTITGNETCDGVFLMFTGPCQVAAASGTLLSSTSFTYTPTITPSNPIQVDLNFSGTSNLGSFSAVVMSGVIGDATAGPWTAYSNIATGTLPQTPTVPEPASLALFGSGLMFVGRKLIRR